MIRHYYTARQSKIGHKKLINAAIPIYAIMTRWAEFKGKRHEP